LIGIEKESNLKLRHSVLKDLDHSNAYRQANTDFFSSIRQKIDDKRSKSKIEEVANLDRFSNKVGYLPNLKQNTELGKLKKLRMQCYGRWYLNPKDFVHTLEVYAQKTQGDESEIEEG